MTKINYKYFWGAITVAIIIWFSFFFSPQTTQDGEVTIQEALDAAISAGEYLKKATDKKGKFTYNFLSEKDKDDGKYNILRHAGTTYSMLELYEKTQDQELLEEAENALEYLSKQIKKCETPEGKEACVEEDDEVKLGGNGLAIVAFSKYTQVTKDEKYLETAQSLAKWIVAQQEEDGEFSTHKIAYSTGEKSSFVSGYYPGEAILGLVRLNQIDENPQWLNAAESAAKWLINVRDKDISLEKINHDHWLLYGLNELHRVRENQIYIDHSFKIVDAILQMQRKEGTVRNPEWKGSYYTPPRSTPTATRSEGLIAAYNLAKDFGYTKKSEEILKGIELGIGFQLQTQITETNASYFKSPNKILGGFHESLTDFDIRIDYVQHNLSALIGYTKILESAIFVPAI